MSPAIRERLRKVPLFVLGVRVMRIIFDAQVRSVWKLETFHPEMLFQPSECTFADRYPEFFSYTSKQLEDNVMALNMPISDEIAAQLNAIFRDHLEPTRGIFDVMDPNLEYIDPSKLPWGGKDTEVDPELDILINQRLSKF